MTHFDNLLSFYLHKTYIEVSTVSSHSPSHVCSSTYVLQAGETHCGKLLSTIQKHLTKYAIIKPDIIITASGPGSFTNIRVQLATMMGLAKGWDCAHYYTNLFSLLAFKYNNQIIAIDNHKGGAYLNKGGAYLDKGVHNSPMVEADHLIVSNQQLEILIADQNNQVVGLHPLLEVQPISQYLIEYALTHPHFLNMSVKPFYFEVPNYLSNLKI